MQRFAIQAGLILLSLLLHIWAVGGVVAVNFALVFLGFISADDGQTETELVIVPIELVELGELNNIAPVISPPEEEPEDEAPIDEPEDELLPEEEVVPEDPVDETLPEDEIEQTNPDSAPEEIAPEDVVPDLDAEPEPEPETEPEDERPEPEPKDEPAVQQPQDDLGDLLNDFENTFQSERETRKAEPKPRAQPRVLPENNTPKPQTPRRGAGERTGNTARLEALLYNYVQPCWQGVDDLPNPNRLNIRMRAELDENGNLVDLRLVEPARRPIGRDPMGIAIDRGLRAVRKCAPYKLPRDDYSEWRDIRINLGPAFEPN